jgi:hypothetical protein
MSLHRMCPTERAKRIKGQETTMISGSVLMDSLLPNLYHTTTGNFPRIVFYLTFHLSVDVFCAKSQLIYASSLS